MDDFCHLYARRVAGYHLEKVLGGQKFSIQEEALDYLASVFTTYLTSLASSCHDFAELNGRTKISFDDFEKGLALAAESFPLAPSTIGQFNGTTKIIDFSKEKRSKKTKVSRPNSFFAPVPLPGESPSLTAIPEYIPPDFPVRYPPHHTYISTNVVVTREHADYPEVRLKMAQTKLHAEKAIERLKVRTVGANTLKLTYQPDGKTSHQYDVIQPTVPPDALQRALFVHLGSISTTEDEHHPSRTS